MPAYIDQLPISDDDKSRLRALGAETPTALLDLADAAPEAFRGLLGPSATTVISALRSSSAPLQDRFMPAHSYPLGASLDLSPTPAPPAVDLQRRDALWDELQRARSDTSAAGLQRSRELESQLSSLLESGSGG